MGVDPTGYLQPFAMQQSFPTQDGDCTNDITHEWGPQLYQSWHHGKMDSFVPRRTSKKATARRTSSPRWAISPETSLPFYFPRWPTHCHHLRRLSLLLVARTYGSQSGHGLLGHDRPRGHPRWPGALTQTTGRPQSYGTLDWHTMPEHLLDAGVTWKVYNDPTGLALFSPLPYFKAFTDSTTSKGLQLQANGIAPVYPVDFVADVATGTLPQVSWIHGPAVQCEHPATAPQWGENLVQTVLDTLTSNPEIWAHTLFILHYDENGGFFDHVPPRQTPPTNTAGEYLSMNPLPADAAGVAGPVGLGFRVPCLLMSPYTAGGFVATDVFDHTSTLFLLERLFGVPHAQRLVLATQHGGRPDHGAGPGSAGQRHRAELAPGLRWCARRPTSRSSSMRYSEPTTTACRTRHRQGRT